MIEPNLNGLLPPDTCRWLQLAHHLLFCAQQGVHSEAVSSWLLGFISLLTLGPVSILIMSLLFISPGYHEFPPSR